MKIGFLDVTGGLLIAVIVVATIVGGPLLLIWALNTLFGLAIAMTFKTWLAALIIGWAVARSSSGSKK